jgi:hypothetical protein
MLLSFEAQDDLNNNLKLRSYLRKQRVSIIEVSCRVVLEEIIAVYFENNMKHTLYGQNTIMDC